MFRVLLVLGTRPEAIKLAPVIRELQRAGRGAEVRICVTGQHRTMLDQVLEFFEIVPDIDLDIMQHDQSLAGLVAAMMPGLSAEIVRYRPSGVVVQGDTTTAFIGALAAFSHEVAVAHVEAGLRTGDIYSPFPEEANRRLISVITSLHCAPTTRAADALRAEGVADDKILVTGNTVVDALHYGLYRLENDRGLKRRLDRWFQATIGRWDDVVAGRRRLVLITGHRRESFGEGLERICQGVRDLAEKHPEHVFVYPVHLNPNVRNSVHRVLTGLENVFLLEPLDYPTMLLAATFAHVIVTDSGGIQEEAPSLKVPVVITREKTEREEAVHLGGSILVGSNRNEIVARVSELLLGPSHYAKMGLVGNPYGDGRAAERIVEAISERWR